MGFRDAETDHDSPLWGDIETSAFKVRGPQAFGYAPSLADALQRQNPDLMHVHGLWTYLSVAAVQWSCNRKPYIVSPHGMLDPWALRNSHWKKRLSAALYEDKHLRNATCLHALNLAEANAIREYGLKNPICVIPNGIGLPEATERKAAGPPHTLLYLGRIHPKKNLHSLIEAWSMAHEDAKAFGWYLVIAGWDQSGYLRELEELSARLNLTGSIAFVGPLFGDAKEDRFRKSSAFILPSLSEGLPMTVLEAWSFGLPVLITPECNLPEGEAAGAAVVMQPQADSIAAALRQLFSTSHPALETMGMNGHKLVRERFQWPQIARQMADVYDWMLGLGPTPPCLLN